MDKQMMTWEELKEKAKELGYRVTDLVMGAKEALVKEYKSEGFSLCFTDNGLVFAEGYDYYKLAENRTCEQMYAIMLNLVNKEEVK